MGSPIYYMGELEGPLDEYSLTRGLLSSVGTMKILHALVGYLAVTAMPFHPLAFASPLAAIDYEITAQNHIEGALIIHVLCNVAETCQTVTTQNHGDSALMKRVPGDIIEARQTYIPPVVAIPVVIVMVAIVAAVAVGLVWLDEDYPKRVAFTQKTVSDSMAKYPAFNWVICHVDYSVAFDGVEGTDWGKTHHELKLSWGTTIGYDLLWATSGTFYRSGDGSFINWAYNGNILSTEDNAGGTAVHFGKRS